MARDHAVRRRAVGRRLRSANGLLLGQEAKLDERPPVEQQVEPLAHRQLASFVLLCDSPGAAHAQVLLPARLQLRHAIAEVVRHRLEFWLTRRSNRVRHLSRNRYMLRRDRRSRSSCDVASHTRCS